MAELERVPETAQEENDLRIVFKKPFRWEDNEYKEVDLSGLEDLTGGELCALHKQFDKLGIASALKEQSPSFAVLAASKVTGIPTEFFEALPAKELTKISRAVFSYFFTED